MLIEPRHIGPRARALLGWCRTLTPDTDGIDTRGITQQDRFEADVAGPANEVVVDVPEALAAPSAHIPQLYMAGVRTVTAVVLAVDVEVVQMLATPREGDVQDVVEMLKRRVARDEEAAPDERADASQDDTQLIDIGLWRSGRQYHALSIAQCVVSLKDSPRILVLSVTSAHSPFVIKTTRVTGEASFMQFRRAASR
jgi:hypothetical protein